MVNKMDIFKELETMVSKLKSGGDESVATLSTKLSTYFGKTIEMHITPAKECDAFFCLSVSPSLVTVDTLVSEINNKDTINEQTILDIWHGSESWRVDVDGKILKMLNPKQILSLILYGIWYGFGDAIPRRLIERVKFPIASSWGIGKKSLVLNSHFKDILRLPVLAACETVGTNTDEIKESLSRYFKKESVDGFADFIEKMDSSYIGTLLSAIEKIKERLSEDKEPVDNIDGSLSLTESILQDLGEGKGKCVKETLTLTQSVIPDNCMIKECVDELQNKWFGREFSESFIGESAGRITHDAVFQEFGLHISNLKPIERNQIDYIAVKVQEISTVNDKLMCVSYINSKLELAEYYRSILQDPKLCKKYKVPHSKEELDRMCDQLNELRKTAINRRIREKNVGITIEYPADYSG